MKNRAGVLIVTVLILALAVSVSNFWSHVTQQRNLKTARTSAELVKKEIGVEARFAAIQLGEYTGGGGQLFIFGSVQDTQSLDELQSLVSKLNLPVSIKWDVRIQK